MGSFSHIPDISRVLKIHQSLVELFSEGDNPISPPGARDFGLLESACMRPNTGFAGQEKYTTCIAKLAALFHSLVKNHAFHNGNKRTALAALLIGLSENDYHFTESISDEIIFNFVLNVSRNEFPDADRSYSDDEVVLSIQSFLKSSTERVRQVGEVHVDQFLDRIIESGGRVKESGSSWVISNNETNRRISRSINKLDGKVARKYLTTLRLIGPTTGISFDEFMSGGSTKRTEIQRYITVFHQLADA